MPICYAAPVNAIVTGLTPVLPIEPFQAATAQVNEWRGRCLDAFTRGETAVTKCLVALAGVNGRGENVQMPHLVGQRLEALAAAIGPGSPFAPEAGKAAATLEKYRAHAGLRNLLCHGTSRVTLDHKGRWTVVLRLVALRSRQLTTKTRALAQDEATELREKISRLSQSLCSQLGQVGVRVQK